MAVGRLSHGERLLVDRRRRGLSQGEAAARYLLEPWQYGLAERDDSELSPDVWAWVQTIAPRIRSSELRPNERCLLLRRRARLTQEEVAEHMGRSRWWVNQMERGEAPCDELLEHWGLV